MKLLDDENGKDIKLKISVKSKPIMNTNPLKIEEMFNFIEKISDVVKTKKYFEHIKEYDYIVGVPIRYILTPIHLLLDVSIERLYLTLTDECLKRFHSMLVTIREFNHTNCIRNKLFQSDSRIGPLIFEKNLDIYKEIDEYEKSLIKTTNEHFDKAIDVFKEYKIGKKTEKEIMETVTNFDDEFEIIKTTEKINEFLNTYKKEISNVIHDDSKGNITYFTNKDTLIEWLGRESSNRILLKTGGSSPSGGIFMAFYELSEDLLKIGFELAVAYPSVDPSFSLTIKLRDKIKVYLGDEILFALRIIKSLLNKSLKNEQSFYKIYTELNNLEFSIKDNVEDLNDIIWLLKDTKKINITKSHLETRTILALNDNKYKFFLSLDAVVTSPEAIDNLRSMMLQLSEMNEIEWVVGSLNINSTESAPFFFIIKNGQLIGVCSDRFDIMILLKIFKNNSNGIEDELKLILSYESLKNTFYEKRVLYAKQLMNILNPDCHNKIELNCADLWSETKNQKFIDAFEIAKAVLKSDSFDLFKKIAQIAISSGADGLDILLKDMNVDKNNYSKTLKDKKFWSTCTKKLQDFLITLNPVTADVYIAKNLIESKIPTLGVQEDDLKKCNEIIKKVVDNQDLGSELKNDIKSWDNASPKQRFESILQLLRRFICKNIKDEKSLNVLELIKISEQSSKEEFQFDQNLYANVLKAFLNKIELFDTFDANVRDEILKYCEKNSFHKIIKVLNKHSQCEELNRLNKLIDSFTSIKDNQHFLELITYIFGSNNEKLLEYFWMNMRFRYLTDVNLNDEILEKLADFYLANNDIKNIIPKEIFDRVNPFVQLNNDIEIPTEFKTKDELIDTLNDIYKRKNKMIDIGSLDKFHEALTNFLNKNKEIKNDLIKSGAMSLWDDDKQLFDANWTFKEVEIALKHLTHGDSQSNEISSEEIRKFEFSISTRSLSRCIEMDNSSNIKIIPTYSKLYGNERARIFSSDFIKISSIRIPNSFQVKDMERWITSSLEYYVQKIKMWGCNNG